ncbi:phenylalanine--tRNA ligase subunit alpha [Candidatus Peregrinibacteria bacterium]|nr:phenylalanine--tRNA ligase subunit alpha [Candidatus Peregrinibacteria bacterium]
MITSLQKLEKEMLSALEKAQDIHQLEEIRIKYLGRKGMLTAILKGLKNLSDEEKRVVGQLANKIRDEIERKIEKKSTGMKNSLLEKSLQENWIDLTVPGKKYNIGHIHPLSQMQEKVEHIFGQMGFAVMDGPEIESEYYNFEGLNIPEHHPARDMQDTFFIEKNRDPKFGRLVLRTHTSPVQVRTMEKYGAPLRIIVPGRVFRYEATDASHDTTFYQVEGLMIDKDISIASLKGVMNEFLSRLFDQKINLRFRPGYFPFVEPGMELDLGCLFCEGQGCRVCKHTGWMEFMGAGMVHPNVLRLGGIDPEKFQGWAFGFGLTRLTMLKFGINDIRLLTSGDLRFLEQF